MKKVLNDWMSEWVIDSDKPYNFQEKEQMFLLESKEESQITMNF